MLLSKKFISKTKELAEDQVLVYGLILSLPHIVRKPKDQETGPSSKAQDIVSTQGREKKG